MWCGPEAASARDTNVGLSARHRNGLRVARGHEAAVAVVQNGLVEAREGGVDRHVAGRDAARARRRRQAARRAQVGLRTRPAALERVAALRAIDSPAPAAAEAAQRGEARARTRGKSSETVPCRDARGASRAHAAHSTLARASARTYHAPPSSWIIHGAPRLALRTESQYAGGVPSRQAAPQAAADAAGNTRSCSLSASPHEDGGCGSGKGDECVRLCARRSG